MSWKKKMAEDDVFELHYRQGYHPCFRHIVSGECRCTFFPPVGAFKNGETFKDIAEVIGTNRVSDPYAQIDHVFASQDNSFVIFVNEKRVQIQIRSSCKAQIHYRIQPGELCKEAFENAYEFFQLNPEYSG